MEVFQEFLLAQVNPLVRRELLEVPEWELLGKLEMGLKLGKILAEQFLVLVLELAAGRRMDYSARMTKREIKK